MVEIFVTNQIFHYLSHSHVIKIIENRYNMDKYIVQHIE